WNLTRQCCVLARRERRYRPYQLHDHLTTIYVSTKLEIWKKDLLSSPPAALARAASRLGRYRTELSAKPAYGRQRPQRQLRQGGDRILETHDARKRQARSAPARAGFAVDPDAAAQEVEHGAHHGQAKARTVALVRHLAEAGKGLSKSVGMRSLLTPGPVSLTTKRSERVASL